MAIRKVAVVFDNQVRPDTTGVYCQRALAHLVEVKHFLPAALAQIPRQGFDLYLNIDDGLDYRWPSDLNPSAWWAIDTHLNLDWCLEKAKDFDFLFVAQRDGAESLQQAGFETACWLPLACDPEIHGKYDLDKRFDICFVGNVFPGPRAELLEFIKQQIPSHFIGKCFFEEMARTYSASRLVFNRSIRNDINMRVFEALACGSLLLTNDLKDNGQEDLFRDGVHLCTYQDASELLDKIAFYLDHETERERIAAAGRAEVLSKDTYRHRMEWLMREVERGLARSTFVTKTRAPLNAEPAPATDRQASLPQPIRLVSPKSEDIAADDSQTEVMALIPEAAKSIFVVGCNVGPLATALKKRQQAELFCQEINPFVRPAGHDLDQFAVGDPEQLDAAFASQYFDTIVCSHCLEHLRYPLRFLRRVRTWLRSDGHLIAIMPSARRPGLLKALLDGHWGYAVETASHQDQLRFFTLREIQKLFFRANFNIELVQTFPGPEYQEWKQKGSPPEVKLGGLQIVGLGNQEVEEFYTARYHLRAFPSHSSDFGLTSIIMVTHNQLPYTRQCVDSIQRYTDEGYELIFVDNASNDKTVEYLHSLPGAKVIVNDQNRGFPAAVNQGMGVAKGKQILLLNNDVIVTTGWLWRLLRALYSDERIGLAGPCSNMVSGPQQINAAYDGLEGLDGFAWDWGQAHDSCRADYYRLVGFCLLLRKEVKDKIGQLDERFGLGCFEDDDYCWRAIQAGYRLVIAQDAFIHHFGGKTFEGAQVDFAALMRKNQALFRAKWEMQIPTEESTSPCAAVVSPKESFQVRRGPKGGLLLSRKTIQLSLCMIVRDNARTIEAALKSIQPWVDEMVVVDTGSKDDTPAIAARLGSKVHHFSWSDSFSAARNESVHHARGQWIFWMDSDDIIDAENGRRLRELASRHAEPSILGYIMKVHCPGPGEDGENNVTVVDHVKLFRNRPDLRFEGRIHEQILPSIRRAGGEVEMTRLYVVHAGYDHSPEGQRKKLDRDLHLLHLELQEQPHHPFTLFNLGMTYADMGEHEKAADFLRRSLSHSGPQESHLRKVYALLVYSYAQMHNQEAAWDACQEGLRRFPKDAELRFREGILLHASGCLPEAVHAYSQVLKNDEEPHFGSRDRAITGFKARQNLALVYQDMGDLLKAEEQWQLIVNEVPGYRPGWQGLAQALLGQGKSDAALRLVEKLLVDQRLRCEGMILRSRVAVFCNDLSTARRELERALQEYPNDLSPLETWCQFLFDHGEPAEAQEAIQKLVRRNPEGASAYHNMGLLHMRQGHPEIAAEWFRQALRYRPDFTPTLLDLGFALQQLGQQAEAMAVWEKVVRLEPTNRQANEALARIRDCTIPPASLLAPGGAGKAVGNEATYVLQIGKGEREVSFSTRGPVDQSILRQVWERDVYGVGAVSQPPETVVDIGAHIGAFSLMAAIAWPGARIIACEADPENSRLLQENLRGRDKIEPVAAAIIGEDVTEVEFNAVVDKARWNSGGGSCARPEPWSVRTRVAAMSVIKLWKMKEISRCDFLKLDCEGSEIPILRALAEFGLLGTIRHIVGEWHASNDRPQTIKKVQIDLATIFSPTHHFVFDSQQQGREGYFTATPIRMR